MAKTHPQSIHKINKQYGIHFYRERLAKTRCHSVNNIAFEATAAIFCKDMAFITAISRGVCY